MDDSDGDSDGEGPAAAERPGVGALVTLLKATGILGFGYHDQIEHLDSIGRYNDTDQLVEDLAVGFDDSYEFLDGFVDAGWVTDGAADQFRLIDAMLAELSGPGNEKLWTRDALAESPQWEEIRRAARTAILYL